MVGLGFLPGIFTASLKWTKREIPKIPESPSSYPFIYYVLIPKAACCFFS
jgi:hypothetical protein